ncbi:Chloramphenicol acetyltransferase 2 [bioreactor metagenome]|uniref:Chloramphenicol acetyltransferase 2 n=1 Tax=bioreactor metagenome TaxID=1076179 RepID=A0A644UMP1_9ZZZZ|nr:chloramphenicol acetyltransferase [Acidaminococcaceae bacterium]
MQVIDLNTWPRAIHYHFFKRMDYAHYLICSNVNVTNFLAKCREKNIPFYYAMIYAATFALNEVEAFKYRIRQENVVLHEKINPSFTAMQHGTDLFKMVTVDMTSGLEEFVEKAKQKTEEQQEYFVKSDVEGRDDLIYITCIPWVSFTNLSHTISFNKEDSVPRLAWGKYFRENGKTLLPFSVEAHHSFVDGIHMGQYFTCLQEYLDDFK